MSSREYCLIQGLQGPIHQISINSQYFDSIFNILHRKVPILEGTANWVGYSREVA